MRIYRIYRRDPIVEGQWYYAVRCKGCGDPIYILDDRSNGISLVQLAGGGDLSVPCPSCVHDDIYTVAEVFNAQAQSDIPGGRPSRVEISKSPRKLLWKAYPTAKATFGIGYIEDRPKAASIVARVITGWADIEVQCARLLGELMGTNIPAAAAVFGSLRSSRAQHDALLAAASAVLNKYDIELFHAYMLRRASLEKERNDLTHGCFSVSISIPEHIVWAYQAEFLAFTESHMSGDESAQEKFRKKQFVYEWVLLNE